MKIEHNGIVHYPRSGGSYVFGDNFIDYLASQTKKQKLRISIGVQPNSSPHFGTLIVFSLAFALGKVLQKEKPSLEVEVFLEVIDTAPAEKHIIENVEYQVSLKESDKKNNYIDEYRLLLKNLHDISRIGFALRNQEKFNKNPNISSLIHLLIKNQNRVAHILDPKNNLLRIRISCPKCGLTDKYSVKNQYEKDEIKSYCPEHGWFITNIINESYRLEYNTPLRNLIRALVYSCENHDRLVDYEWLRVTGSDYSGFYQEQTLYKCASLLGFESNKLPSIVYAPLVIDWSGAKISKSLYLEKNAYNYLPSYLMDYNRLRQKFGEEGLLKLFSETESWLLEPYRLFRHYSVYYFMRLFKT